MKKLFSSQQYNLVKSRDLLPLRCYQCNKIFYVEKRFIKKAIDKNIVSNKFCSHKCNGKSKIKNIELICKNCKKIFQRSFRYTKNLNLEIFFVLKHVRPNIIISIKNTGQEDLNLKNG